MNAAKTLFCALSALGTTLPVIAQDALLYTTLENESAFCNQLPALDAINPRDVVCVVPNPITVPCAEKFLPDNGLLTLLGDEDGDSRIWESQRPMKIDALQWRKAGRSQRHLYFSPSTDLGNCVSGVVFRDGDVGRIEADGQFVIFLKEDDVKSAFSIPAGIDINVDAVTVDESTGLIYLSLEDATAVFTTNAGAIGATDGAILAIPTVSLGEPCLVNANSGLLVAMETQVDNMVTNSTVWHRSGAPAISIGDLDGLELEGGVYVNAWGVWSNLCFSGEDLTGGIVLSTAPFMGNSGSIKTMNAAFLGRTGASTTGRQVGLFDTAPNAYSLNALESAPKAEVCHFVLETPTPFVSAGQVATVEIGGGNPAVGVVLLVDATPDAPCVVHPTVATLNNPCFPDLIRHIGYFGPIPVNAAGMGQFNLPIPMISGWDLVFQGVTLGATGAELSTPVTVEIQ